MEEQPYIKNGVERLRHRMEVLDGSPLMTVPPEVIRELLTRLEQAEQAVQRVREMLKAEAFEVHEYVTYKAVPVEYIEEALDGDTRRLADQGLGDNLARTTKNGDNNE